MEKNINSPFLELISEDNLKKMKIDADLISPFKIVIYKIDEYFQKHNLINCRDWQAFFEKFLLSESEEQVSINMIKNSAIKDAIGEYDKDDKRISIINPNDIHTFCHEFIHFLVMHDSNILDAEISNSAFFNEGMTEYLTSRILGTGNGSSYFLEYRMADFYCKIAKDAVSCFLNDKFAFNSRYAFSNLGIWSQRFEKENSLTAYLGIQRLIIEYSLSEYNINSFEDFVNIVTIINNRPRFDSECIDNFFEMIVNKYLAVLNLDVQQNSIIKNKLFNFCKVSNKYQLYGEHEVAEYLVDGLLMAFDSNGNHYNEFPLNGPNKRGMVEINHLKGVTTITHRDKIYRINYTKMNCKNWKEVYEKMYNELRNEIYLFEQAGQQRN